MKTTQATNTKEAAAARIVSRADAAAISLAARIEKEQGTKHAAAIARANNADAMKSKRGTIAPIDAAARRIYVMPAKKSTVKTAWRTSDEHKAIDAQAAAMDAQAQAARAAMLADVNQYAPADAAMILPYDDIRTSIEYIAPAVSIAADADAVTLETVYNAAALYGQAADIAAHMGLLSGDMARNNGPQGYAAADAYAAALVVYESISKYAAPADMPADVLPLLAVQLQAAQAAYNVYVHVCDAAALVHRAADLKEYANTIVWPAYTNAAALASKLAYCWARQDKPQAGDIMDTLADAADDYAADMLARAQAASAAADIDTSDARKLLAYFSPDARKARQDKAQAAAALAAKLDKQAAAQAAAMDKQAQEQAQAQAARHAAARREIDAINAMPADARAALLESRKAARQEDAAQAAAVDALLARAKLRANGMPDSDAVYGDMRREYLTSLPTFIGPMEYAPRYAIAHKQAALNMARAALVAAQTVIDAAKLPDADAHIKRMARAAAHTAADTIKAARQAMAAYHRAARLYRARLENNALLYGGALMARACLRTLLGRTNGNDSADNARKVQASGAASAGFTSLYSGLYYGIWPAYAAMLATGAGLDDVCKRETALLNDAADVIQAASGELSIWRHTFGYYSIFAAVTLDDMKARAALDGKKLKDNAAAVTKSGQAITPARYAMRAVHTYMYGRRTVRNNRKNKEGQYMGVSVYTTDTIEKTADALAAIQPDAAAALLWQDILAALKAANVSEYALSILRARMRGESVDDIAAAHNITKGRVSQHMARMRDIIKMAGLATLD